MDQRFVVKAYTERHPYGVTWGEYNSPMSAVANVALILCNAERDDPIDQITIMGVPLRKEDK
jgi:hypothetical protein